MLFLFLAEQKNIQPTQNSPDLGSTYLGHSQRASLCECVIVQIDVCQVLVGGKGVCQRCYAGFVDAILRHLYLDQ